MQIDHLLHLFRRQAVNISYFHMVTQRGKQLPPMLQQLTVLKRAVLPVRRRVGTTDSRGPEADADVGFVEGKPAVIDGEGGE